jgi:hypothetical protein
VVIRSSARRTVLLAALWLALGTWVGAWLLFGAVVAPTAFALLPTSEAGALVGPVLSTLHLYGAAAGGALAALAWALGRGWLRGLLPLAMALACLYSQFGVSPEIDEIRELAFGPEGNLEAAGRFTRLHRRSTGIFVGVGIAGLVLLGLHANSDAVDSER